MKRARRRRSIAANEPLALSGAAAALLAVLARWTVRRGPTPLDQRVRAAARSPRGRTADTLLKPLFPVGLPFVYIPIAYATAIWLASSKRRGGPAIIASAWTGWLAHRAAKAICVRERPPGPQLRVDSFPSGHSTGAAALAITCAYVLSREGVLPRGAALALGIAAPALMGASRVLADDHWATDVVGGWLLGGAVAGIVCATANPLKRRAIVKRRLARSSVGEV